MDMKVVAPIESIWSDIEELRRKFKAVNLGHEHFSVRDDILEHWAALAGAVRGLLDSLETPKQDS